MHEFYKKKPVLSRTYLFPAYILLPIILATRSYIVPSIILGLLQTLLLLSAVWSVKLRIFFTMHKSTHKQKADFIFYKKKSLCKIEISKTGKRSFEYKKRRYLLEEENIHKLKTQPEREFSFYKERKEDFVRKEKLENFGKNEFKIETPNFIDLFLEHCIAPFFVFQIFCGVLWCLDEYVYHALFTIFMLVLFEVSVVFQRIKNMKEFRTMNLETFNLRLLERNGGVKEEKDINSKDLLPGDVVLINNPGIQIPCDLLLLEGYCAVNEAMLSGESIPFSKENILERKDNEILDLKKDKKHILYGGTKIIKIDQPLKCFVLRTGFDTQQGKLVRTMMCNEGTVTANNKEAFLFILFLLFFALVASFYAYKEGVKLGKTTYKIALEIILIITNVVPPELPLELTIAVNASLQNLISLGVFCLEPFRIPYAGKVNVCCFDKTGTLTDISLDVAKIDAVNEENIIKVSAVCHSLVLVDGKAEGDPMETSLLKFLKMDLVDDHTVRAIESSVSNKKSSKTFKIIKKYSFSSELRRMTVVGETSENEVFIAMKGAPEIVKEYLSEIPEFYEDYKTYASEGYRVIAMASKPYKRKVNYVREKVEEGLTFSGFVLFESKLKKGSKECVDLLVQSNHKIVMITGDNVLTATCVAQKLGFYNGKSAEGEEIERALNSGEFMEISVFARADPKHKELIINGFKKAGMNTLMCGDGTNDVGALKVADVGVALVEGQFKKRKEEDGEQKVRMGDASVAAPFTAKTGSLNSVLDIVRQGRSALVTTIQMYKILALNSLISAYSLSVLDAMGVRYGDVQLTISGFLIAFAFMFLTRSKPLKEISKERPLTKIFNPYIILSVLLQTLIHIISCFFVIQRVKTYEIPVLNEKFVPSMMNSALFLFSTYQQISTFIINYIGRPFRESMLENTHLRNSLVAVSLFVIALIFGIHEDFNKSMEVVNFESGFKLFLCVTILIDFIGCFFVEKLCFYVFMLKE